MKLLLTPKGLSDFVVERIPRVTGLIPRKQHVIVLLCNDGKDTAARTDMTPGKLAYFTRLLTKLCMLNNDVVNTVAVTEISFFEPAHTFHQKLRNADFFYMAGFIPGEVHVERIFQRDDHNMFLKRVAVANKVVTNTMSLWAICGSAMSCGATWCGGWSPRTMPHSSHQMLEMLADGYVDYASSSGPEVTVTDDLRSFQICSGTGLVVVTSETVQHAEAFRCVKGQKHSNWQKYDELAVRITAKLHMQIQRLSTMVSLYHDGNGNFWRLHWGTGHFEWY